MRYFWVYIWTFAIVFGAECFENQTSYIKFVCEDTCQSPTLQIANKQDSTILKLDESNAQIQNNEDFFTFVHNNKSYVLSPKKAIFAIHAPNQEPIFTQFQPTSCAYVDGQKFGSSWADIATFSYIKQSLNPSTNNLAESDIKLDSQKMHPYLQEESYTISTQEHHIIFSHTIQKDGRQNTASATFILKPLNSTQAYITQLDTDPECGIMIEKRDEFSLKIYPFQNKNACESLYMQSILTDVYYNLQPSFECAKAQTQDEIAICHNANLAKADRELVILLESTKDLAQEYITKRQECQDDTKCLQNLMTDFLGTRE